MSLALGPPLRRVLDRLGEGCVPIGALAQRLLALSEEPAPALARRLLASALGGGARWLPDDVDLSALPQLLEGPSAEVALEDARFVVVDLETTGLSPERSTILEIGAVRIEGLRLAGRFQTLVDPGVPIPASITALTGIDRTLVDGAPSLARALAAFHAWAAPESGAPFVAHNAAFDAGFVARGFEVHALAAWAGPRLCTRCLARRLLPALGRYDLDTLAARFGIANRARHRALGDAEAAARALLEMIEIGHSAGGLQRVGDLVALQARRKRRRRAPATRRALG